jgi:hypothetical protein
MRCGSKHARFLFIGTLLLSQITRADFVPIPLTSDSFNQDIVVENTAPPPVMPVTTASMDAGTGNTNFSWYERGYKLDAPTTGLPAAGSIIASDAFPDDTFQFAPNYKTNNAVMVDSTLTTATLTLTTPTNYSRLSFLTSAGNGPGTVQFTVHYQNGTTQTGTFTSPDWQNTVVPAYTAYGQVDVNAFTFANVNASHPALFSRDIALSNINSPITRIDFSYVAGAAHNAIFAVSGSANQMDPFTPVAVTGYNVDLVVESTAARRQALTTATTASMEGGNVNAGRTWYEKGYYPLSPASGLPGAGSILTSLSAPDHHYALPASYTANNALLVDSTLDTGILTPATPAPYEALSFLCSAGHGPVTNECVLTYANGSSQTNTLVIPSWFDAAPAAFIASGDLDLNTRFVDSVGSNSPRLFGIDLPLANTVSAVTNITLSFTGGAANSHAAIFAISGSSSGSITRPSLSIATAPGGSLRITTTQPGQLQSTTALRGTNTIWQNEGAISGATTISPTPGAPGKFYRVLAQ